jgi:DNA polymerase epsilon subunit 3
MAETEDLPKTIARRVEKYKLSTCSDDGDIAVHKDALLAFSESARIFIHYISAT